MTTNDQSAPSYSTESQGIPLRSWLSKFIPLGLMQFFAVFCYNSLRTLKDSVIIRFIGDPSVFNWLKTLVIMPFSLGVVMLISILGLRLGQRRQKLSYILLSIFLVYYAVFIFLFLPSESLIHFPSLPSKLMSSGFIPKGIAEGLGNVLGYWGFSIFYGISEIFGAIVIQVVCWGTASAVCKKEERDKFFPAFAIMSQLGGLTGSYVLYRIPFSTLNNDEFKQILIKILMIVILFIALIAAIYYFIEINVMNSDEYKSRVNKTKSKSSTPTFKETFGIIISDPYIRKIAMIVFAYNVSIALVEVCWKDAVTTTYGRSAYPSIHSATLALSSLTTFAMAIFSSIVLSRFSLVVRAMLPIFMMGITAILFLFFFIFSDFGFTKEFMMMLGLGMYTPIQLAVIMGCIQNIGAKSAKYSTFDSSKEEMLAALDVNEFNRGKSAVDVVVARGGKSFSGVIQVSLLVLVPMISSMISQMIPTGIFSMSNNTIITPKSASSVVITEDNRRSAAKKILEFISRLKTNIDEENNQYSLFIPKDEGIEFTTTKEGIKIFTKIIPDSPNNSINNKDNKPNKTTNQKMIAPYLLFFLSLFISMWAYAVIAIYPDYQKRIKRQKIEEDGRVYEEVEDLNEKKISVFSFSEFIALILLSFFICGTLFFFVSKTINSIIKDNQAKSQASLAKGISSKKSTKALDKDPILS